MTADRRDALDAALEDETLTAQERRNLTAVREWRSTWGTDAAALVDSCYADSTEVYLPFQGFYFVKPGESKAKWRTVEIAAEKLWQHREMNFVTVVARGDTVALETGPSAAIDKNGVPRASKLGGAIFLKFDSDGRIIFDHTFMRTAGEKKDPTSVSDPDVQAALEAVHDAIRY